MRSTSALAIAAALSLLSTPTFAQPPGGPGGFDRGQAMGLGALLFSEQVREEIDLLEEQEADLRAMGEEMRDKMRSAFSGMRDLPPEERRAAFEEARGRMSEIRDEINDRVKEVLMPHQFERLQQIEVQNQMQRRGTASLAGGRAAEALGLTEDQKAEIERRSAEESAKLQEQIAKLRADARDRILEVLSTEQRAKYDQLVGKPFEMQRRDGGRFQRGGRGGPGEQRRGGRPGGDRPGGDRPELE
ncbi:MAG: hypothetical protein AAGJ46_06455 [Planctomycetota bacterium]